jgi:hypothetical protein
MCLFVSIVMCQHVLARVIVCTCYRTCPNACICCCVGAAVCVHLVWCVWLCVFAKHVSECECVCNYVYLILCMYVSMTACICCNKRPCDSVSIVVSVPVFLCVCCSVSEYVFLWDCMYMFWVVSICVCDFVYLL